MVKALTLASQQHRGPLALDTPAIPSAAGGNVSEGTPVIDFVPGGERGHRGVLIHEVGDGVAGVDGRAASR